MENDLLYWQVMNLLDDDCAFKEFENPLQHVDANLANQTKDFIACLNKKELNSYIYDITSLMAIKIMCEESNKNMGVDIDLHELNVFKKLYINVVSKAEFFAEKTEETITNTLLYGFVYADKLLYLTDESKKVLNKYTKKLLKPLYKDFEKDYFYACRLKYGHKSF